MRHPKASFAIVVPALLALLLTACGAADTSTLEPTVAAASSEAAPPALAPATVAPAPAEAGVTVFQVQTEGSEARFLIDEVLAGSPNTVVGATSAVRGEIRVNPAQPGQTILGPMEVEAGSLVTDNNLRNGAIRTFILDTGQYPIVTFTPTALVGLPETVAVGESFSFQITGDLTIRDVTRSVTFDVTVNAEAADRLTGSARATVLRSDYGLTIPSVPQVAEVSDEVILELDFTALAG